MEDQTLPACISAPALRSPWPHLLAQQSQGSLAKAREYYTWAWRKGAAERTRSKRTISFAFLSNYLTPCSQPIDLDQPAASPSPDPRPTHEPAHAPLFFIYSSPCFFQETFPFRSSKESKTQESSFSPPCLDDHFCPGQLSHPILIGSRSRDFFSFFLEVGLWPRSLAASWPGG